MFSSLLPANTSTWPKIYVLCQEPICQEHFRVWSPLHLNLINKIFKNENHLFLLLVVVVSILFFLYPVLKLVPRWQNAMHISLMKIGWLIRVYFLRSEAGVKTYKIKFLLACRKIMIMLVHWCLVVLYHCVGKSQLLRVYFEKPSDCQIFFFLQANNITILSRLKSNLQMNDLKNGI